MINALKTALYGKVTTGSNSYKTIIGSRFYYMEAPQEATFPYAVFSDIALLTRKDSISVHEEQIIQISNFSKSESSTQVGNMDLALHSLLDDCEDSFTVDGYEVQEVTRIAPSGYTIRETELNVFQSVTQYRIYLTKSE
jgi:hypothetical protein